MTDETKATIKERAAEWVFQQGVSTVLLVAILAALGWIARYGLVTAIPNHIAALRQIVIDVESSHREERELRDKKFLEQHEKEREFLREVINSRKVEN